MLKMHNSVKNTKEKPAFRGNPKGGLAVIWGLHFIALS